MQEGEKISESMKAILGMIEMIKGPLYKDKSRLESLIDTQFERANVQIEALIALQIQITDLINENRLESISKQQLQKLMPVEKSEPSDKLEARII